MWVGLGVPAQAVTGGTQSPGGGADAWASGGTAAQDALFADFASLTVAAAKARYQEGDELQAVLKAWEQVGVRTT